MKELHFFKQADLLLQVLPYLAQEKIYALKGGSAINFFIRDLPRLSVDIDLTYLLNNDRMQAIAEISNSLERQAENIRRHLPGVQINYKYLTGTEFNIGLFISRKDISVKIEPNLVLRGVVFPPVKCTLSNKAQELFERTMTVTTLSFADLYGGKICAALDRQHPRDLFDILILMQNEGITDEIRQAFIVYLVSHSRPMLELLNPRFKDIEQIYNTEFQRMTDAKITLRQLEETRRSLVKIIKDSLTAEERHLILSIKSLEPDWDLLGIDHIKNLPAVQWKLTNLRNMDRRKHKSALKKLRDYLEI